MITIQMDWILEYTVQYKWKFESTAATRYAFKRMRTSTCLPADVTI